MSRRQLQQACVILLALVPQPVFAAWRACQPAAVTRPERLPTGTAADEPQPAPANAIGCRHGTSLRVGDALIWRCQVVPVEGEDLAENAPPYAFMIDRPGHERQILPDDLMAGRFRSFEVLTVDLDGDGKAEQVLAAWNMQGNGLGVNRWTIRVFDQDWKLLGQFDDVSDWGDSNLVRAPRGRRGCDIAITSFVESVNRRGVAGISFQARFQRLSNGRMEPATDRAIRQRRYDFAFQRQRTAHFRRTTDDAKGNVGAWLANAPELPAGN